MDVENMLRVIREMYIRVVAVMIGMRRVELYSDSRQGFQNYVPRRRPGNAIFPMAVVKTNLYIFLRRVIGNRLVDLDDIFYFRLWIIALAVAAASHNHRAIERACEIYSRLQSPHPFFALLFIFANEILAPAAN